MSEFAGAVGEPIVTMQHGITRGYSVCAHTRTLTHTNVQVTSAGGLVFFSYSPSLTHTPTQHTEAAKGGGSEES